MKHNPFKWTIIFLILTSGLSEQILAVNNCRSELILFNICAFIMTTHLSASQPINNTQLLNARVFNKINESKENGPPFKCELTAELHQPEVSKLVLPLTSLFQLELQEKHLRQKKSISKKKMPVIEMRTKLKQLMANISDTFNDMDWYFALEQLENQTCDVDCKNSLRKGSKKYEVRKMNKVDEQNSDGFLDQFIEQMYEINPLFIDKIRSRIDKEISSNKRQIRLASPLSFKITASSTEAPHIECKKLIPHRKEIVKSVQLRELIPPYNENEDYNESYLDTDSYYNSSKTGKTNVFSLEKETDSRKRHESDIGDMDYQLNSSDSETTTLSTTTLETFYDVGDYYRERDEDYDGNLEMKDIEEYEINKDSPETSTVNLVGESERIDEETHRSKEKARKYKEFKDKNQPKSSSKELKERRMSKSSPRKFQERNKHKKFS